MLTQTIPGIGGLAITSLQVITIVTSFQNEKDSSTRVPYSKFSNPSTITTENKAKMIPSRNGMMIIYTPALVVGIIFCLLNLRQTTSLGLFFCTLHFTKRVAEVMFLHNYSGSFEVGTACTIGLYYSLIATMVALVSASEVSLFSTITGTGKDIKLIHSFELKP